MLKPSTVVQPTQRANRRALRQLMQIWSLGRTGYLQSGTTRFALVHGEPANERDLAAILRLVHAPCELEFLRVGHDPAPVPPRLAARLWTLAQGASSAKDLRGTAGSTIYQGTAFRRRMALPLSRETQKLIGEESARVGDTIRFDRETKVRVLNELAALCVLGVIRIQGVRARR